MGQKCFGLYFANGVGNVGEGFDKTEMSGSDKEVEGMVEVVGYVQGYAGGVLCMGHTP